jgi:nicotinamide riboside kinase
VPEATARCIAIVGAESTGKTTLARELAAALHERTGQRVAWVPEWLRSWCDTHGRTPQAHEQAGILREQHARIDAAAAAHDWVVCDTTALMTAVYSRQVFADTSLDAEAAARHRARIDATLLTALDLPWVADGVQRDGPQVRAPVDAALRTLMAAHGIAHAVVTGQGPRRVQRALAALVPWLPAAGASTPDAPVSAPHRTGLFTRLAKGADDWGGATGAANWRCECCLPDEERALKRLRESR